MSSVSNIVRHCLSKVLYGKTETNRLDKCTIRYAENCLTCQAQRIIISDKTSSWRFLCSGVPQGLMLGPVLFNSIVDCLNNGTEGSVGRYVDDMKHWCSDWCTTLLYCHSEGHWQSAETGWENPHEVQQKKMSSPVPEGMASCNSTGWTERLKSRLAGEDLSVLLGMKLNMSK